MRRSNILLVGLAFVLISLTFFAGAWIGYTERPYIDRITTLVYKEGAGDAPKPAEVDFAPFWKAWHILEEKYVKEEELNREDLVWGAISGMVKAVGDPYTVFFPPKDNEYFESEIKGEFEGIGAEIAIKKDILTIISPLEGSPAKAAGLKAGDRVLNIDDTSTADITLEEAVRLIRGPKGTNVTLTVIRSGEEEKRKITITRNTIVIPVLEMEKLEDGIFRINLFSFSGKAPYEFQKAVREMLLSNSDKLILDLRGNPGGFFDAAVAIASWFLPEGEIVAREEFRDQEPIIYRSRGHDVLKNIPVVILIDKGSASASEILAGALQEHGVATLIGEKTFGKGSVQELETITNNTSLKLTIARWLTPNGRSISKDGLEPDIVIDKESEEVENGEDKNGNDEEDIYLIKAREVLLQR